jgi:dCMP deaminase
MISAKQEKLDTLYMDTAERFSQMSYARLTKVGAVLVKDENVISFGWNGTPSGMDNNCETELPDGTLVSKPEVCHAEQNLFSKLTRKGGIGADGATLYVTMAPCPECAKQIKGAGVVKVVYRDIYRLPDGIEMLKKLGVTCVQISGLQSLTAEKDA